MIGLLLLWSQFDLGGVLVCSWFGLGFDLGLVSV